MIGFVTPDFKAAVRVTLIDERDLLHETEVFVDTGFNGDLSLPHAVLHDAGASFLEETIVQLADGHSVTFAVYVVLVEWSGTQRRVEAFATSGDPVLGMRLLEGSELRIEVKSGGAVTIEPL